MSAEKIIVYPYNGGQEENSSGGGFSDAIAKYAYYWPLFLVSIVVALLAAYVYMQYTKPVYTVRAKLLIKEEGTSKNPETALKEINTYQGTKNVDTEIEILQSRGLMARVVNDLQLWISYQDEDGFGHNDLYLNTPLHFKLEKSSGSYKPTTLAITILDKNKFEVEDQDGNTKEMYLNSTFKSGIGEWKLERTADFNRFIGKKIKIQIVDPQLATDKYLGHVTAIQMNKKASVIDISMEESTPEKGQDIVNKLIAEYNAASESEKDKRALKELDFIDQRLASLTGELNAAERNVEGFRSSRGLTDISSESKVYLENVQNNDARRNEVNVQLSIIKGIESYINSPENAGSPPSTLGIADPGLVSLVNKLIDLQLQYDRLLATTPEKNPIFDPINLQIKNTKTAIRTNIGNMKSSLLSSRNQLNSYNNQVEASIKTLPGNERQLISIQRQQNLKQDLYVYLQQKREEAALGHASTISFSETVDQAYIEAPKKPLAYTIALIAGIIIPAGLVFGRNLLNNRVTTSKQIEETTAVPISGELIYEQSESPIVVHPKSGYALGEQFRALRTDLQSLHGNKQTGRVTLITSSIAGEGKSFVTSNLGVALAASGKKTIILELDLRKPKISKNLNLPDHKGLSDYLNGEATLDEIIQSSKLNKNLFIIGTGALPDNPSELLEQTQIDELIASLRTEYDDILIDTPPVFLVTDALILSRLTDVSLYLVRQNYTYINHLEFIKQLYKDHKMPKMKIIFNGIQMRGQYRYGYDYYTADNRNAKANIHAMIRNVSSRLMLTK